MKKVILTAAILLVFVAVSFSQEKPVSGTIGNIIDSYFKPYSNEPQYRSTDVTEEMMNNIREKVGVWGNPKFDKFMRQIKLYKRLSFKSDKAHSEQILADVEAGIKRDKLYKPYFKWDKDGIRSSFYIRSIDSKIVEFAFITIAPTRNEFSVSSFNGDDINIDTIRSFTHDK